eukprot:2023382-Pyramimonas_sp.AAC.1
MDNVSGHALEAQERRALVSSDSGARASVGKAKTLKGFCREAQDILFYLLSMPDRGRSSWARDAASQSTSVHEPSCIPEAAY